MNLSLNNKLFLKKGYFISSSLNLGQVDTPTHGGTT